MRLGMLARTTFCTREKLSCRGSIPATWAAAYMVPRTRVYAATPNDSSFNTMATLLQVSVCRFTVRFSERRSVSIFQR